MHHILKWWLQRLRNSSPTDFLIIGDDHGDPFAKNDALEIRLGKENFGRGPGFFVEIVALTLWKNRVILEMRRINGSRNRR